jgi:hypothetical protein
MTPNTNPLSLPVQPVMNVQLIQLGVGALATKGLLKHH